MKRPIPRSWCNAGCRWWNTRGCQRRRHFSSAFSLDRRFGPLPGNVTRRIAAADTDRLDRWFDRALDADGLAAVFGD